VHSVYSSLCVPPADVRPAARPVGGGRAESPVLLARPAGMLRVSGAEKPQRIDQQRDIVQISTRPVSRIRNNKPMKLNVELGELIAPERTLFAVEEIMPALKFHQHVQLEGSDHISQTKALQNLAISYTCSTSSGVKARTLAPRLATRATKPSLSNAKITSRMGVRLTDTHARDPLRSCADRAGARLGQSDRQYRCRSPWFAAGPQVSWFNFCIRPEL